MFGIGGTELLIILLFAFLIFGPDQLPKIGRTVGRAMRQFKNAQEEMTKVIKSEVYDPDKDSELLENPLKSIFDPDKDKEPQQKEEPAPAQNKETFAQRKARLAREHAASSDTSDTAPAKGAAQTKAQDSQGNTEVADCSSSKADSLYGLGEGDK